MKVKNGVYSFKYIWLIIGGMLMSVYNANSVFAAAWLAPLFMLRFTRTTAGKRFIIALPVIMISHAVLMYGPFSHSAIPPLFRIIFGLICGSIIFIPFLIDRLAFKKIDGFISTLVFPAAWVSLEFLISKVSPISTFGVIGYTQFGNLQLMQLSSVTGIWGISFIIIWTASVVNWVWEREFNFERIKNGIIVFASILVLIILGGELRLRNQETVKSVKVSASSSAYGIDPEMHITIMRDAFKNGNYPTYEKNIKAIDELLGTSAINGSEIVFWQEYALFVGDKDEEKITSYAMRKAAEKKICLGLPMGIVKKNGLKYSIENTVTWISPDGKVLARYTKSYTAPWEMSANPYKKVSIFKTGSGTAATVICFDMDFPWLIRQAGNNNAELMLVPSYDWRGISPFHSHMAVFRAVENGFSLVRPAGENGVSISSDAYGRVYSLLDNRSSRDRVMTVDLPLKHVKTIYSLTGDLFAWLSIAGLIVLAGMAIIKKN